MVGYTAQGKSGLESVSNFELLTSNSFFVDKLKNEFQDKKNQGDNVVTTLDTNLQEAAYDALGSNKGAVVVMDPSTGKILAMVSKSAFSRMNSSVVTSLNVEPGAYCPCVARFSSTLSSLVLSSFQFWLTVFGSKSGFETIAMVDMYTDR